MDLFIKIDENDVPQEHPVLKENLKQAFPNLDFDSDTPPSGWAKFQRVDMPNIGVYQKFDASIGTEIKGLEYKIIDGVVTDVWHILDLTDDEKTAKQDAAKSAWNSSVPAKPRSWTFDEESCEYVAPVPCPQDGKLYIWNEDTKTWDETAQKKLNIFKD